MTQKTLRPMGVTVLAVLATVTGIISLILGILLLVTASILASVLFVANGALDLVPAIGYLDGNGWSWILAIIFGAVNILGSTLEIVVGSSNNILGIVFSVITIFYLTRSNVRVFFGRGSQIPPGGLSTQTALPMATTPTQAIASVDRQCPKCGDMIPRGAGICRTCGTLQ